MHIGLLEVGIAEATLGGRAVFGDLQWLGDIGTDYDTGSKESYGDSGGAGEPEATSSTCTPGLDIGLGDDGFGHLPAHGRRLPLPSSASWASGAKTFNAEGRESSVVHARSSA